VKTLLRNLRTLFQDDMAVKTRVEKRNIRIGKDALDELVAIKRFPFILIDRDMGIGESFIPTDAGGRVSMSTMQPLRRRIFHIVVRIAIRTRGSKESSLIGGDGLLVFYDEVMNAIFSDVTVGLSLIHI